MDIHALQQKTNLMINEHEIEAEKLEQEREMR
jgi:hypothetical protein